MTYGRSDSRVTLSGRVTSAFPISVMTWLPVTTPARLSVSKKRGAYANSPSTPKMLLPSQPNDPP